jgi:pimeloyl-ACP methyl ester carboxylesterase
MAQQAEEGGDVRRRDVAGTTGGAEALAAATVECVAVTPDGLVDDVATSVRQPDLDLSACVAPVLCLAGRADEVAPPAFARWWAATLPHATDEVVDGGHALHLAHWTRLLTHSAAGSALPR